ncbi:MAG: XdhC family protein, partial [Burkholderiales bacterium]|nr:XdhC family protein [Burkholderiales bacterium]
MRSSAEDEPLSAAARWLAEGASVELFTVVATWGSGPRPVGAQLAIREDGQAVGSVSGGCIEDDLIRRVRTGAFAATPTERLRYGVHAETAHRFGLPCGGTVELVRERLGQHSAIEAVLAALARREVVAREVDLASGRATVRSTARDAVLILDAERLVTVHGPRWRLILIGAGQLARWVAEFALALEFEVMVCDPRTDYDEPWRGLSDVERRHEMPDDLVRALVPDARTAVVALTHDPKLDELALIEALRSEAFYVGALGSRRTQEARRKRLAEFGLGPEQLARLRAPVGLDIGAKSVAEIALAIAAELVAVRSTPPALRAPPPLRKRRGGL